MENSQIEPTYFNVVFKADDNGGSVKYDISLTSEISGHVNAKVLVYAYGIKVTERNVDFCSIGWKQFCPMYPGSLEVDSIQYLSRHFTNMVPGIAYTFPDIDALVRVLIVDGNDTQVGCIQASFSNKKTVAHVGAKWATAIISGIGLLVSAVLSVFGNSASASIISANAVSLFSFFQSTVILCMLHVQEVPPIVSAWAENIAWSMGLIRVTFMQQIFRWYVQATGGTPTQYLTSSSISVLVQRSLNESKKLATKIIPFYSLVSYFMPSLAPSPTDYYQDLEARSNDLYNLQGDQYLKILRGVERVGYKANIEPTSIVCTGFTFFVLFLYVLVGLFMIAKTTMSFGRKRGWSRTIDLSRNWKVILKGILQRYIYIGFPQLVILSLWEFTVVDSPAVVVLAVMFLLLCLIIMGWVSYRTLMFGAVSVETHNNAAAILYGNPDVLNRYGFFYTMFDAKKFYWGAVFLAYLFVKALFVALAQKSGKTQALVVFLLDLGYTIALIKMRPFLDKATNIVNFLMSVVNTINSFFFLFFSELFGQPSAVGSIMGLVFFVLNAVFSFLLLILIIAYSCIAIFSKNPDARFSPAKDDRTSFQKKQMGDDVPDGAQELFELGQVAKDHQENWANEMYKLKAMVDSSDMGQSSDKKSQSDPDKPLELTQEEEASFGAKLMHKLTGGKSFLRRNKSQKTGDQNTEVPDALDHPLPKSVMDQQIATHARSESNTPMMQSGTEGFQTPLSTFMHDESLKSMSDIGSDSGNHALTQPFDSTENYVDRNRKSSKYSYL
ncbi:hypothetical protein KL930_005012 [Ogataea haglerorum]|uniref:uncharacterized protein n=1 Tax=Ogataea haglerorum TaxID=1937702 RepID=UPI001C899B3B|nr:uncharacterized protein KL911_005081 [Ogataea haglerorum]KAG7691716.1 hypothetical protein KL915_005023 [Ogataea haglerorum]KAG7692436.1 hypothetical protein KL951_005041 [Ogataea haglerorum]KAG7702492.1 hypothetical protein KL914_005152 [Ogataea haglerorum]KAG7702640.1 hypothetical protein KL950_005185 [Ogataea haglerorum]KAG7713343.1 hypothetical protein KL913_005143 [Ogataea haglerorum]